MSSIIGAILHTVNLFLTSGIFPLSCKFSVIVPLIKKPGLDDEILKNYRPVANLTFLTKVIETALLRVYNDITTTILEGKWENAGTA